MKGVLKLFVKGISWLIVIFIILTLIIAITRLSKPTRLNVDLDSMGGITREIFLRRHGDNLSFTKVSSVKDLKDDVIEYYGMLLKGELGWTYQIIRTVDSQGNHIVRMQKMEPVDKIVVTGFKRSMKLLSGALVIAIIAGIVKGVFDSKKGKKKASTLKLFSTVVGLSLPVIFLVPLLQFIVAGINKKYGFNFPVSGYETLKHMILPTVVLSILPTMYIARITAVAMDEAYEDEYVRTAISKGSSKLRVMWIHVFRNVIVEVAGSLTSVLTIIISDLALVEYLFDYRGLTYMMLEYYDQGQSDLVTGLALVLFVVFLFFYMLFKLLKYALDPKGRRSAI